MSRIDSVLALICFVSIVTAMPLWSQEKSEQDSRRLPSLDAIEPDKQSGDDQGEGAFTRPIDGRSAVRYQVFLGEKVSRLIKKDPADERLLALKKQRCRVAVEEVQARLAEYRGGRSPVTEVLKASGRLATSVLALEPDTATYMEILKHRLKVAQVVEKYANLNLQNGIGTKQEAAQATYERLTAEILIAEERARRDAGQARQDAEPAEGSN